MSNAALLSPTIAGPGPAERFGVIVEQLCRHLAEHSVRQRWLAPLVLLLHNRLHRAAARFSAFASAVASIGGPPPPPATPRPARPPRVTPRPALGPPLPRGRAWLVRLVPGAPVFGSQLAHLLGEPDMVALLVAAPHAARLLRPLCRMLGVEPRPPLPPPARRGTPPPAPRPALLPAQSLVQPGSKRPAKPRARRGPNFWMQALARHAPPVPPTPPQPGWQASEPAARPFPGHGFGRL